MTLVMTPIKGKTDAIGSISLESRGADRLALGFALAPEAWGKGLATEAAQAMIGAAFGLTPTLEILASVRVENEASKTVLGTQVGSFSAPARARAPARGGLVDAQQCCALPARIGRSPCRCGARRKPTWRAPVKAASMSSRPSARVCSLRRRQGGERVSFRREKFIEFGWRPDGGDGAARGDAVVEYAG